MVTLPLTPSGVRGLLAKIIMKIYLESLGCCRNQIDSEVMLGRLASRGHEICREPSPAEVIIVNTCGFIAAASAEAVDTILAMAEYKKTGACIRLVITGCLPERFRDDTMIEALPEVDAFLGTGACDDIVKAVETPLLDTSLKTPPIGTFLENLPFTKPVMTLLPDPCARDFQGYPLPRHLTLDYSAYVKISEGCNRKCTYCIIPQLRGRQRSRTVNKVVTETGYLLQKGVREIILVGENTTDYGSDLIQPQSLSHLLEAVSRCADFFIDHNPSRSSDHNPVWLRLLYTHPSSITKDVIIKMASLKNICTYYDVPVQHADSGILKRMGRNYTLDDLYRLFASIRETAPDAVLRTTLITGFPGETEANFQTLLKFVEDIRFNHLGVFPYSDSEDLTSHHFKNHIPEEIGEERRDIIMTAQSQISGKRNETYLGKTLKVLVEENPDKGIYLGRTEFQAPEVDGLTFIYGSGLAIGAFADVKITETHEYDLAGEAATR